MSVFDARDAFDAKWLQWSRLKHTHNFTALDSSCPACRLIPRIIVWRRP